MKSIAITFFLFLGLLQRCPSASGQNQFAPQGAEWWYQGDSYDFMFGPPWWIPNRTWTDHVLVSGDTVITGISCRKIHVERRLKNAEFPDSISTTRAWFYVYDNIDTAFVLHNNLNRFTPLYVYNAAVNDTICLPITPGTSVWDIPIDSSFCFMIDSIVMEPFGGVMLKSFYTHTLMPEDQRHSSNWGAWNTNTHKYNSGKYTEKLGGTWPLTAGLFPLYSSHNVDGGIVERLPSGKLSCYQDNELNLKMSDIACDSIPTPFTGLKKVGGLPGFISLFPNPVSGKITLSSSMSWPKHTQIILHDMMGRTYNPGYVIMQPGRLECDLSKLPEGLYFLHVQVNNQVYAHKIVVHR